MSLINSLFRSALLACLVYAGAASAAEPGTSGWTRTEYGAVRLVTEKDSLDENGEALIGVQMRLTTGWRTYWRTPGETGVPTKFDWSGSRNLAATDVSWPTPSRFSEFEMETFGYEREIIFPLRIKALDPGEPVDLQLRLIYGVCKNICIPMELELAMDVPAEGEGAETRFARDIDKFMNRVPGKNGEQGLEVERVVVEQGYVLSQVEVYARSDARLKWPDAAVELPPGYRMGIPTVNVSVDRRSVVLRMPLWSGPDPDPLEGKEATVTLWDEDGRAVEHTLIIERRASTVQSGR